MTLQHWYDGSLITSAVRLEDETAGYSMSAQIGEADIVRVVIDDPDGTLDFVGYKAWVMKETACIDPVLWRGYVSTQRIRRADDAVTGTARRWEVDLIEDNGRLGRTLLRTSTSNRPTETVTARIAWLLTEQAVTTHSIADYGLVDDSDVSMDPVDYRGRFPIDVLRDCALACGFNFFVRWRQASADRELAFYDPEIDTSDVSTFQISNDDDDIDYATYWPPVGEMVLERDPSRIASGVYLPYSGGNYYSQDVDTIADFGRVDQVAPTSSVKTSSAASALVSRLLGQHDEQDLRIRDVRVIVPKQNANDVKAGQLVYVTATHLPGFTIPRLTRVARKSFARPDNLSQDHYALDLELIGGPCIPAIVNQGRATAAPNPNGQYQNLPFTPTVGTLLVIVVAYRNQSAPATTDANWTQINSVSYQNSGIVAAARIADGTAYDLRWDTGAPNNHDSGYVYALSGGSISGIRNETNTGTTTDNANPDTHTGPSVTSRFAGIWFGFGAMTGVDGSPGRGGGVWSSSLTLDDTIYFVAATCLGPFLNVTHGQRNHGATLAPTYTLHNPEWFGYTRYWMAITLCVTGSCND